MPPDGTDAFWVWGVDDRAYGPVDLNTLEQWFKDERIVPDTFLYVKSQSEWLRAKNLAIYKALSSTIAAAPIGTPAAAGASMSGKRFGPMKLLAEFTPGEATILSSYFDELRFEAFQSVVIKGEPGNAMFMVLEGELRAFDPGGNKEVDFTMLRIGDYFGEISLLDQGSRSASVQTTQVSRLARMTADQFAALRVGHPVVGEKLLLAIARASAVRLRRLSKQFIDSMNFRLGI
jgi:hypothetical protein